MAARSNGTAGAYVQVTVPPASLGAYTICGWACKRGNTGASKTIWAGEQSAGGFNYAGISCTPDDASCGPNIGGSVPGTLAIANGVPFFWALVVSGTGSNNATFYGYSLGDAAFSTDTYSTTLVQMDSYLRFFDNAYSEPFNGSIDNVMIFTRALSAAELAAQRWQRKPIAPNGLYLWLPLDALTDYGGAQRALTMASSGSFTNEACAQIAWSQDGGVPC